MNAVDFVRLSLEQSKMWVMGLITDMKDAPTTSPTPNGGNHPLWVLGHLAYSEAELRDQFILGKPNPLPEWKELFGQGSTPVQNAAQYPPFDELLAKFEEVRADTLKLLDTCTDEDLDKPSNAPEEAKDFFPTVGHCLSAIPTHFVFHGGQVADARRAAGRDVLMG
jgi:hypothetical protein